MVLSAADQGPRGSKWTEAASIRLCAKEGESWKRRNDNRGGDETRRETWEGWWGSWHRVQNRGEKTQSQTCSHLEPPHFILLSFTFFPQFFNVLCQTQSAVLLRWSFGPLVWKRYKGTTFTHWPNLWYWCCQNCQSIIFFFCWIFVIWANKGNVFHFEVFELQNNTEKHVDVNALGQLRTTLRHRESILDLLTPYHRHMKLCLQHLLLCVQMALC